MSENARAIWAINATKTLKALGIQASAWNQEANALCAAYCVQEAKQDVELLFELLKIAGNASANRQKLTGGKGAKAEGLKPSILAALKL